MLHRNKLLAILSTLILGISLSGCGLLNPKGGEDSSDSTETEETVTADGDSTEGDSSADSSEDGSSDDKDSTDKAEPTEEPTPEPTGPQTPEEYDLFLQERGSVVVTQLSNITTGMGDFNKGDITEKELRKLSKESFEEITKQTKIVKETEVPEGAEDRKRAWLSAASAIENTQTMVTNCLAATDPVCRAIGNTITPLAEALNS